MGVKVIGFEKQLCKRIIDICVSYESNKFPKRESEIQIKLCIADINACPGDIDKYKTRYELKKIIESKRCFAKAVPEETIQHQWSQTGIHVGSLCKSVFKHNQIEKENSLKQKNLHTDIVFTVNGIKKYLEIKYPRGRTQWHFLQHDCFAELSSDRPFCTPFLDIGGKRYITDFQEGTMLVDFIRLLSIKGGGEKYFAAFFKKDEILKKEEEFNVCVAQILNRYMKDSIEFAITRPQAQYLDRWECVLPESIQYFTTASSGCEKNDFTPKAGSGDFKYLHWGDNLVAFLLKLETEPWNEGTIVKRDGKCCIQQEDTKSIIETGDTSLIVEEEQKVKYRNMIKTTIEDKLVDVANEIKEKKEDVQIRRL